MHDIINKALAEIETKNSCRVLFACESGSRAWGFASPDSDYDVRFIYTHPLEWHLQIGKKRDTIEQMLPGDLDLAGWELSKMLTLFSSCNLALNEWIGSPLVYLDRSLMGASLQKWIPDFFNGKKALHHYLSLARKVSESEFEGEEIRIKKLFYVIRPLFACLWILRDSTMPPTDFVRMLGQGLAPVYIESGIKNLLEVKKTALEGEIIRAEDELRKWIKYTLSLVEVKASEFPAPQENVSFDALDDMLRTEVLGFSRACVR